MANPPPPYDNITGISRAVMKDNAQESLADYNGNARPGELVVNSSLNIPTLFVGNAQGQLTRIGNTGDLSFQDSTVFAATNSVFTIVTTDGSTHEWDFRPDGSLDTPGPIFSQGFIKTLAINTANLAPAVSSGAGAREFVTDANNTVFGNLVVGGGANAVPVYSDGTVWRIG